MGDIKGKLEATETTKVGIRNAIISKGVDVPAGAPFSAYAGYVNQIASGTGSGISSVVHDDTLTGSGTDAYPLGVTLRPKYFTSEVLVPRWGEVNTLEASKVSPSPAASGLRQGDIVVDRAGTLSYVDHPYDVSSQILTTFTYLPTQMDWDNIKGDVRDNAKFMEYVGDTSNFSTPHRNIVDQLNYLGDLEVVLEEKVDQINGPMV